MTKWKYGFLWTTLFLFGLSITGHWVAGWFAFVNEQEALQQPVVFLDFLIEISRDTFENWQSEFLQLIWQVAGLAYFVYVGSPQSKDGDERKEEKLDLILKRIDPTHADEEIRELERRYPKA